jgi:hypothetical protein
MTTDATAPDAQYLAAVEALSCFLELWEANHHPDSIEWTRYGDHECELTVTVLHTVLEAALEGFGHKRRQVEAEQALMLLLLREENATVEFTPAEMARAPRDGSFVSSRNQANGNEVLAFAATRAGRKA